MKDFRFVGFWHRVLSGLFDWLILSIISAIVFSSFNILEIMTLNSVFLSYCVFTLACAILFWKLFGATPGKLISGMKILDPLTGRIPSISKLVLRWLFYPVSLLSFLLGDVWIVLDSRKQSWHDKIAGTVVVKKNKRKKTTDIEPCSEHDTVEHLFPVSPSHADVRRWYRGRVILIISTICFCVTIYYINFADERLLPGAKAWLYESEFVENTPENNGFYHLAGLFVPENLSSFEEGYSWVKAHNESVFKKSRNIHYTADDDELPSVASYIHSKEMAEVFNSESFIQYCTEHQHEIAEDYTKIQFIENRIKAIQNAEYFKDTLSPHFLSTEILLMDLANYNLLKNYYLTTIYLRGNKQKAISALESDIVFIRDLLAKADVVILKFAATLMLQRDLRTCNYWLDIDNSDPTDVINFIRSINLLSMKERDMEKAAKREFNFEVNTSLYLNNFTPERKDFLCKNNHFTKDVVHSSKSVLFKPHKTINQHYLIKKYSVDLSHADGIEFVSLNRAPYIYHPSFPDFLNNYIYSMIFLETDYQSLNREIARIHNADAYLRMLQLKALIMHNHCKTEEIHDFLESHKDTLCNPYTNDSFRWDFEKSCIFLDGPYQRKNDFRSIQLIR